MGNPVAAPVLPEGHDDRRPGTANGSYAYNVETRVAQAFPAAQQPTIVGGTRKNKHEGIGTSLLADA